MDATAAGGATVAEADPGPVLTLRLPARPAWIPLRHLAGSAGVALAALVLAGPRDIVFVLLLAPLCATALLVPRSPVVVATVVNLLAGGIHLAWRTGNPVETALPAALLMAWSSYLCARSGRHGARLLIPLLPGVIFVPMFVLAGAPLLGALAGDLRRDPAGESPDRSVARVDWRAVRVRGAAVLRRIATGPPAVRWGHVGVSMLLAVGAAPLYFFADVSTDRALGVTLTLSAVLHLAAVLVPRAPVPVATAVNAASVYGVYLLAGLYSTDLLLFLAPAPLVLWTTYLCARSATGQQALVPILATLPAPWLAVPAVLGASLGYSRTSARETGRLRRRTADLEQLTEVQHTRQVTLLERNALARDLHDIVGHHVTAIAVLAEAGQARGAHGGEDAGAGDLARIADTARSALRELDTLVGSLRDPDAGVETASVRGLADLGGLLGALRSAEITGSLTVRVPRPVGQGVQLTVYRIVQECLTNAIRHSGASTVHVDVQQQDGWIEVVVDDDGTGLDPATAPRGRGLLGIAERVHGHGGTWSTGRSPAGGCRVLARLPAR